MLVLLILAAACLLFLSIRLLLYKKQLKELAAQLSGLSSQSNQRLTCFLRDRAVLDLCVQMNQCLEARQQTVLKAMEAEKELKYTIACVSHDIRTPLTGAAGYMQLVEKTKDEDKRREYCKIIRQKLGDLELLLDELFLFTRLAGNELELHCEPVQVFPVLCDALLGFYQQFQEQGRQPSLLFQQEDIYMQADSAQLGRVFRNLISNALSHGTGAFIIQQKGNQIVFENQVLHPEALDADALFQRFYRSDKARQGAHSGLGLSVSKELIERMGGHIRAALSGNTLQITLELP